MASALPHGFILYISIYSQFVFCLSCRVACLIASPSPGSFDVLFQSSVNSLALFSAFDFECIFGFMVYCNLQSAICIIYIYIYVFFGFCCTRMISFRTALCFFVVFFSRVPFCVVCTIATIGVGIYSLLKIYKRVHEYTCCARCPRANKYCDFS